MNTSGYGGLNLNINTPPILRPKMEVPVFSNKQEAADYPMGPDSSVIGMDSAKQVVWILRTDSNGNKIVCMPRILGDEYVPEPEPDLGELVKKINGFEAMFESINKRFDDLEELIK